LPIAYAASQKFQNSVFNQPASFPAKRSSWLGRSGIEKTGSIAPGLAAWQRLSAGDGTKGARLHDWAKFELANISDLASR
jgi:hypothetical protein